MTVRKLAWLATVAVAWTGLAMAEPRNLIIFVADGLRSGSVTPKTAPALAEVRDNGVDFHNSHSMFPTLTTVNAASIATGHRPGDTGDFGNVLYVGKTFDPPYTSAIAPLEDDVILGLMNQRYGGDYLNETSLLQAARAQGFDTAAIGKLGPIEVQDVTARSGDGTIVIDDLTGYPGDEGVKVAPDVMAAIKAAGLPALAPDRGLNSYPGSYNMPGVQVANVDQQAWMAAVAAKVVLPRFKAAGKPFVMVFWARDPDITQHYQGDSLNTLTPGINGPTSLKAVRNTSDNLQTIRDALVAQGLDKTTDILVTADHGFSTISRQSKTSAAAKMAFEGVVPGFLPPGFLGIDMAGALGLKLYDPSGSEMRLDYRQFPRGGGSMLGDDPAHPKVVVAFNGGSDLIYLPGEPDKALAAKVVSFLTTQDYTGAIFVRDDLGPIPGSLPFSAIGLSGSALTPSPAIVVGFANFGTGCDDPEMCGVEVGDTELQQGQGMHGSFGRQDTHNFMAAIGPDFKAGFRDPAPVGNADLAITAAKLLGLDLGAKGKLTGRVMTEALAGGASTPGVDAHRLASAPADNGFVTTLDWQEADGHPYFDAAGTKGRTIGLK
jgi:arylsulfatase A-like enzyme